MGEIVASSAIVYRGARRRYLSVKAAARSLAWETLKSGYAARAWSVEDDTDRAHATVERLARAYESHFRRQSSEDGR